MFNKASQEYLDVLLEEVRESLAVMNAIRMPLCKDCNTYIFKNHKCEQLAIGVL